MMIVNGGLIQSFMYSYLLLLHFVNDVELVLERPLHLQVCGYLLREIMTNAFDEYGYTLLSFISDE